MTAPPGTPVEGPVRHLAVVLGDQLAADSPALRGLDRERDAVLMMEVAGEATHVPSHRQRTALFLAAMRQYAAGLAAQRIRVRYVRLDDPANTGAFPGEVRRAVAALRPERLRLVEPGEHRVAAMAGAWARELDVPVDLLANDHFLTPSDVFARWARNRKAPFVMEHFYRQQRRRLGLLLDGSGKPVGGRWNFDASNRKAFGASGPAAPAPRRFEPNADTREVMRAVERRFPDAPGRIASFAWPVTAAQARAALDDFVARRLADFGRYQDAMWTDEPFLHHSLLSPPLNLGLLDPRDCVRAAVGAYEAGRAPIESVEAFVRQIVGWREFIRGVYRHEGPGYADRNGLGQTGELPAFYWTGETDMQCMRQSIGQVLEHGYGHHIQRLMVTGNFALMAGVHPRALSDWYLGMYVDAVDWVTLPNTLGMAMHADARPGESRGVVGTKPYAASGRYVQRMSNYCAGCRYDPGKRSGEDACPLTVFYWDFLRRTRARLRKNVRMRLAQRNEERLSRAERRAIARTADGLRAGFGL